MYVCVCVWVCVCVIYLNESIFSTNSQYFSNLSKTPPSHASSSHTLPPPFSITRCAVKGPHPGRPSHICVEIEKIISHSCPVVMLPVPIPPVCVCVCVCVYR
eukprot:GHVR01014413.1.p1 GENE.GHVR01014413.1~~GHVR01014413.1.p1  ORF type:complete len:102 (-),score=35.69 GHVR01014413.1:52-357(-)